MRAKNGTNRKEYKILDLHTNTMAEPLCLILHSPSFLLQLKIEVNFLILFYLVLPCILSMYIYILERNKKKEFKDQRGLHTMHPVSILS